MIATMRDDPSVVALVKRAQDGDQRAWDQLVERYAPLVWSVCMRHRLSPADADDVGASVWLRLVEGLEKLREPAALPGWLVTVARNECLRVLRGQSKQIPVEDEQLPDVEGAAADEWLLRQERFVALRQAFEELPERCRRLLAMLFADPPTAYAEISSALDIPVGGIGPNRMRCLGTLRKNSALTPFIDPSEG